ncbi:MAG: hypothetical protein DRI61_10755 [Chloroflexi bacterium]|nr:MAG: hypothetical protein DRI61_10755 [Chloroflexota bacterium]HDN80159.1 hypothetical protein [Chloroflexota bacterium]
MAQGQGGERKLSFMDGLMFGCGFYTAGIIFAIAMVILWLILVLVLSALGIVSFGNLLQQGF